MALARRAIDSIVRFFLRPAKICPIAVSFMPLIRARSRFPHFSRFMTSKNALVSAARTSSVNSATTSSLRWSDIGSYAALSEVAR